MAEDLVKKAKEHSRTGDVRITPEITALALAWVNNEVTFAQVCKALEVPTHDRKAWKILAISVALELQKHIKG
jgi:hypothetical protein